jgi:colanic acid biosynthesis glycosyl transferase WcaI
MKARKPKIVFINRYFHPDESATSQMLSDLARALAASHFDVHVICSRQLYGDATVRLPLRETVQGVQVDRVATTRFGRSRLVGRAADYGSFYATSAWALLKSLRRGDIIVAKTDPPLLSLLAAPIARFRGATLINWQQDVFPEVASHLGANPLPRWLNHVLQRLRDYSLRSAYMNVLIGDRMRQFMASRGVPGSRLCTIANWADGAAIRPKRARLSRLRLELDLDAHFVVCYSGNLGRAHEFDTLIAAAEALREEPRFLFLIIGGGAKMNGLRSAVAARALTNFRFLPYQPRETLADSLAAADVHLVSLLPALEGLILPSKLYGILAAGRPLVFVGDANGDIALLVTRERCGRTVGVGDAGSLVAQLRELESDPAELEIMGERALQLFNAEYSLDRAVEHWVALLDAASEHSATHRPV